VGPLERGKRLLREAEAEGPWLLGEIQARPEIRLLHTLQTPLIDQCTQLLRNDGITRITVVSPFLDHSAAALRELYTRFKPQCLRLVLQPGRATANGQALEGLLQAGVPLELYGFDDAKRYLHAKIYLSKATTRAIFSRAAPTAPGQAYSQTPPAATWR